MEFGRRDGQAEPDGGVFVPPDAVFPPDLVGDHRVEQGLTELLRSFFAVDVLAASLDPLGRLLEVAEPIAERRCVPPFRKVELLCDLVALDVGGHGEAVVPCPVDLQIETDVLESRHHVLLRHPGPRRRPPP